MHKIDIKSQNVRQCGRIYYTLQKSQAFETCLYSENFRDKLGACLHVCKENSNASPTGDLLSLDYYTYLAISSHILIPYQHDHDLSITTRECVCRGINMPSTATLRFTSLCLRSLSPRCKPHIERYNLIDLTE